MLARNDTMESPRAHLKLYRVATAEPSIGGENGWFIGGSFHAGLSTERFAARNIIIQAMTAPRVMSIWPCRRGLTPKQ